MVVQYNLNPIKLINILKCDFYDAKSKSALSFCGVVQINNIIDLIKRIIIILPN